MAMEAQLNSFSADPNRKIIPTEIETKDTTADRKSTRLNSSHPLSSRMPSSA